jgi:hypothetical protein
VSGSQCNMVEQFRMEPPFLSPSAWPTFYPRADRPTRVVIFRKQSFFQAIKLGYYQLSYFEESPERWSPRPEFMESGWSHYHYVNMATSHITRRSWHSTGLVLKYVISTALVKMGTVE